MTESFHLKRQKPSKKACIGMQKLKFLKFKPAFSLIEMLMALLVASLLLAALAPVITKRPREVTYEEDITLKDGKAIYSTPGEYTFIVPDNVYELKIQASAGGGGGGGSAIKSYTRVYTNPKEIAASDTNWSTKETNIPIQKGWYSVEYNIIGAGGYGGYGYGQKVTSGTNTLCETDPKSPNDPYRNFRRIPKAADSGRDLCYVPIYLTSPDLNSTYRHIVDVKTRDSYNRTCWVGVTYPNGITVSGSYDATRRMVCNRAVQCNYDLAYISGMNNRGLRSITTSEMKRIINMSDFSSYSKNYLGKNYLDLTCYSCQGNVFSMTSDYNGCYGVGYCKPSMIILHDGRFQFSFSNRSGERKEELISNFPSIFSSSTYELDAGEPRCVYEILDWQPYTGGGGPAGGKTTGSIKISKDGTNNYLKTSIADGVLPRQPGEGRYASAISSAYLTYYKNNEKAAETRAITQVHGNSATESAHGEEQTNINITGHNCVVINNNNILRQKSCTYASAEEDSRIEGRAGTGMQGGQGSGGAQGGITGADTYDAAKGKDATKPGYGGGGGACKRDARSGMECSPGGKGGPSQITLTYKTGAAGGGGGAGGAVGYNKINSTKSYLRVDVKPKDIIKITVGKGGSGGGIGAKGLDGSDTIIVLKNNKKITFYGGKGGNSGMFDDTNIQAGSATGGIGGNYPKNAGENYEEIVAPLTAKGISGSQDDGGYAGGQGGDTVLGYKGGCGGMQKDEGEDAYCQSESENGANALSYDAINNQNGGAGGGGGGFNYETETAGIGGNGADGYVVIEWGN